MLTGLNWSCTVLGTQRQLSIQGDAPRNSGSLRVYICCSSCTMYMFVSYK